MDLGRFSVVLFCLWSLRVNGNVQEKIMQMELLPSTEGELKSELEKTKTQLNNLRRGLFGRFDKLVLEFSTLQEDMLKIQQKLDMTNESGTEPEILEFPLRVSEGV